MSYNMLVLLAPFPFDLTRAIIKQLGGWGAVSSGTMELKEDLEVFAKRHRKVLKEHLGEGDPSLLAAKAIGRVVDTYLDLRGIGHE